MCLVEIAQLWARRDDVKSFALALLQKIVKVSSVTDDMGKATIMMNLIGQKLKLFGLIVGMLTVYIGLTSGLYFLHQNE